MITHNNNWGLILEGDVRHTLKDMKGLNARTCVTSPPYYGLRDYGHEGQIGLEQTPEAYIKEMVEVFRLVRDCLSDDGTLWLNIGDSYAGAGYSNHANTGGAMRLDGGKQKHTKVDGIKNKDLIGIPWMLAFALRADGWYLRQDIIWHKPNPMPESVRDRCTKAHEYVFLLSKSERYYFDSEAMKEPATSEKPAGNKRHKYADAYAASESEEHRTKAGLLALTGVEWATRNRRSVWTVATRPYKGVHFATFPPALIEPCVLAGSAENDIVLDPFGGSGTTMGVALKHGRNSVICELNPSYIELINSRVGSILK